MMMVADKCFSAMIILPVALLAMANESYAVPDQSESSSTIDPKSLNKTFRRAVERVKPGIVTISAMSGPRTTAEWSMRDLPPEHSQQLKVAPDRRASLADLPRDSTGSGIIFDDGGSILTCSHVVEDADSVFVYLDDGRRLESAKILVDPLTDIAVIQLSERIRLPAVPLGDSDELRPGDWVISIGNPYGLGMSMSAGIISATQRHLPNAPRTRLIQTDAATNPGNSGGALIDLEGTVVGISEGGYGVNEGFQGIGFAIPINDARHVAMQLIENGKIDRAYLGCFTQDISAEVRGHLGITNKGGLIVTDVVPKSAADRAGIKVGDVFTHIAGELIGDHSQLSHAMEQLSPGKKLELTIVRAGHSFVLNVPLDTMPINGERVKQAPDEPKRPSTGFQDSELGIVVDAMSAEAKERLGYAPTVTGVLVTHVSLRSIASKEGVCAGMVILRMGNTSIRSVADFEQAVGTQSLSKGFLVLIATPHRKRFVVFQN